jgi:hypothetical protein
MLVAIWGSRVMLALVPGSLPRADDVGVDARVVGFACAVAVMAGIIFGVASALTSRDRASPPRFKWGTRVTGNARRRFGRRLIVAAEVALSVVLLIGAGSRGRLCAPASSYPASTQPAC